LPAGFRQTFRSRYVQANDLRMHAVIGGDGPPLLLIHGWPQTWYAWRMVMPTLARDFTVIAVDQRGIGLTGKPQGGYDVGTLGADMVALMSALGHERFAVYGTDVGMPIAHALAVDSETSGHADRVARLIVSEALLPGLGTPPMLFQPPPINERLWHLMFNQLPAAVNEALVHGREDIFFGAEFDASAGVTKLPRSTVDYYLGRLRDGRDALRGSFSFYRSIPESSVQNIERGKHKLTMPVLGIGGLESSGAGIGALMATLALNAQTGTVPHGHWVAEQAPQELLALLTPFLAPYRDEG
jgi:pimeloyl-ACP methyl ester carboxylesterase